MQRIGTGIITTLLLLVFVTGAWGALPQTINYQGYLKNSDGTPVNSAVSVVFSLYAASSGLWTETQSVTPANGVYSVQLGSVAPLAPTLFASDTLYLGVKVGADPEMTPRQQLTMAPYAYRAGTADSVTAGGVGTTAIADNRVTTPKLANGSVTSAKISGTLPLSVGGTGGTTAPSARGVLGAAASGANADITSLAGLTTPLSVPQGGTGSATQNFVDLSSRQTIGGTKSFSNTVSVAGQIESTSGGFKFPGGTVQISAKTDCMGRYEDNNNGTVTDCRTGLIWLKNANCTETAGGIIKGTGTLNWFDAGTWTANLTNGLCGLTDGSGAGDWRLPTKTEWMAMVTSARKQGFIDPALTNGAGTAKWAAGDLFNNVQANWYWSSSIYAYPDIAWFVDMWDGDVGYSSESGYFNYVWPVRAGQ
jgi:hypothetical protein